MEIRPYRAEDLERVLALFQDTVYTVNARDYSRRQLEAWAGRPDRSAWGRSLLAHAALVAEDGEGLLGFADLDVDAAYLDRLYVHRGHQGEGIGSALCGRLEALVPGRRIQVHASLTAQPFFEGRGYHVVREQQVERRGVLLTNFLMERP